MTISALRNKNKCMNRKEDKYFFTNKHKSGETNVKDDFSIYWKNGISALEPR